MPMGGFLEMSFTKAIFKVVDSSFVSSHAWLRHDRIYEVQFRLYMIFSVTKKKAPLATVTK